VGAKRTGSVTDVQAFNINGLAMIFLFEANTRLIMKHEIHRLQSVFLGGRYAGALLHTAVGWDAYNARNALQGTFQHPDAAISRLRTVMANTVST
jgi:hypothetical protein